MKVYHFSLIFVLIFFVAMLIVNYKAMPVKDLKEEQQKLNEAVDDATWTAMSKAAAKYSEDAVLDKDQIVEDYFQSLFAAMDIEFAPLAQRNLRLYHPVMVVTDKDGFYVHYYKTMQTASGESFIGAWSEKVFYTYYDKNENLVYSFRQSTGTDSYMLTIYDIADKFGLIKDDSPATGVYEVNLKNYGSGTCSEYPAINAWVNTHPWSTETSIDKIMADFELLRNVTIAQKLEEYLNYYCNESNQVAFMNGISYEFTIPAIQTDSVKGMSDVSLLVLFQGYPYQSAMISEKYNRFVFSNSQFVQKLYYTCDTVNGYYHRAQCPDAHADSYSKVYSKEDAARLGLYACPKCGVGTGITKPSDRVPGKALYDLYH